MGRRRKAIDKQKLRTLALVGASTELMARTLNVSRDTLERRFRPIIDEARSDGETQILGKIFTAAMRGARWALELSAINRCGWALRPETIVNVQTSYAPPQPNAAELRQRYAEAQAFVDKHLAELEEGNGQGRLP